MRLYSKVPAPQISDINGRTIIQRYGVPRHFGRRRALLCYLTAPVAAKLEDRPTIRFSNEGIARTWPVVLNELGFIVDIIDWDNTDFQPTETYDLVIFHGGKNFSKIHPYLRNKPQIIHFLTGSYWKFNNNQEDLRRHAFKRRHGVEVPRDRYIEANEDPVNEAAAGIIVLGDPSMKDTYPYDKVITINNASYPDDHFTSSKKDYAAARKKFLFFAGSGNIHKGLDLVIDSFKELDEELYIITVLDQGVMNVFRKELKRPNIHLIGEIPMRTPQFYEIIDQCGYVILPSCSEGQAGSVVECMNQGLIPIVSKETRLDTRGYGYTLPDCRISTIQRTIKEVSQASPSKVESNSRLTREVAITQHSADFFHQQLKQAVQTIIGST